MKKWLPILVACVFVSGCASNSEHPGSAGDSAPKVSAPTQLAGDYTGKWTSTDGATGTVHLSLKKPVNDPWQAKVSFTYNGDEATTTTKSVETDGTHIAVTYDYDVQGNTGGVQMSGDLAGDTLQGNYTVTTGGNPGTWTARRTP
jgi:uncharacterized protein YceK